VFKYFLFTIQFDPLMKQTIHWFTRHGKYEGEDTICLLESIFEGLCDEDDAALRSASANYFRFQFRVEILKIFVIEGLKTLRFFKAKKKFLKQMTYILVLTKKSQIPIFYEYVLNP